MKMDTNTHDPLLYMLITKKHSAKEKILSLLLQLATVPLIYICLSFPLCKVAVLQALSNFSLPLLHIDRSQMV